MGSNSRNAGVCGPPIEAPILNKYPLFVKNIKHYFLIDEIDKCVLVGSCKRILLLQKTVRFENGLKFCE